MNTAIGMGLGGLAGIGYSQALAATVEQRTWVPWLLIALLASVALAVLTRWVRLTGGFR